MLPLEYVDVSHNAPCRNIERLQQMRFETKILTFKYNGGRRENDIVKC